jgi:phosphonoacetaldehyde hydrolase
MPPSAKVKLVIFDWAGTLIDFGAQAAAEALLETFARYKLMLTMQQVRSPMGLPDYEHVRALLEMPAVGEQFQIVHGRRWNEADALELLHDLRAIQAQVCRDHCGLIPEAQECLAKLRSRGIKVGTTIGERREIAELLWDAGQVQGFESDCNVCVDDVPSGHPAPWMIFRVMQELDVFPPACVVKVGDTVPDIEEGRHAGCWAVGVAMTGNEAGLWPTERERIESGSRKLLGAGAHYVIATLAKLAETIDSIEDRLQRGERP